MSNEVFAIASESANRLDNSEVHIWVEDDDHANHVSGLLEALGYTVLRELGEGEGPARLRHALPRLTQRHKLTQREQDILARVLAGRSNLDISRELEISRATVKWHMHNIFAKTNTTQREGLLRLALQLGGARPPRSSVDLEQRRSAPEPELELEPGPMRAAESILSKAWF